jgi:hypothetical protein
MTSIIENETARVLHTLLLKEMHKYGLAQINVDYTGFGDEGMMEGADAITEHPGFVDLEAIDLGLQPAYSCYAARDRTKGDFEFVRTYILKQQNLAEVAMEVADCAVWEQHPGWYDGSGAHGLVTFYPRGQITVKHETDDN